MTAPTFTTRPATERLHHYAGRHFSPGVVDEAAQLAGDQLRSVNEEAIAKRNYVTATLTRFQMDLDKGEDDQILLRSLK